MKTFVGKIVSAASSKSVVVAVDSLWMHPIYRKKQKVTTRFACQCEIKAKVGEIVTIAECRPLSATKRFKVMKVNKE